MTEEAIRDELAQVIVELYASDGRTSAGHARLGQDAADAILSSPVIRRIQAEAIREAVGYVRASEWWHESTNINLSDRVREFLHDRADRIERAD